ncbi:MAG: hypothetical protein ACFFF9_13035 [Candidatus Thorarchaeota archaeon]
MTLHGDDSDILRQDSDPYCLTLLGLVVLSAYIFNYLFLVISYPSTWILVAQYFLFVGGIPVLIVFFLIGYFRPEKGKAKNTAMSIAVVLGFFFVVFTYFFTDSLYVVLAMTPDNSGFYYSIWGLGGSILTAAGFAIMHNREESTSPGIMDTSTLRFGPEPEPEPEPEPTAESTSEPEAASEESASASEDTAETTDTESELKSEGN